MGEVRGRSPRALAMLVAFAVAGWACASTESTGPTNAPPAQAIEPTVASVAPTPAPERTPDPRPSVAGGQCAVPSGEPSVARIWNEVLLDAIRRDVPAPTVHSRNLYHLSAAMWDAWAAFEPGASPLFAARDVTARDVAAARVDAIAFASAVMLEARYDAAVGAAETEAHLDATLQELCGVALAEVRAVAGDGSAAALGVSIADAILQATVGDGSNEADGYVDPDYRPVNEPLIVGFPGTEMVDPNRWQPLDLDIAFFQNDLPAPDGPQEFIGSQWGHVTGFALPADGVPGLPIDPGPPPLLGEDSDSAFRDGVLAVIEASAALQAGEAQIDIGPSARGNNPLGTNAGTGHAVDPASGEPYPANVVDAADYYRTIAEYWADGPDSETPPGHWNSLANAVSDALAADGLRLEGSGPVLDRLEWDVKLYLTLNGALHDAAVAAWGAKAYYDYARPISMIRYMGELGQSSDPAGPSFHPDGLPLVPGLIEVVTAESSAPGERHESLRSREGDVVLRVWQGSPVDPTTQTSGVGWVRATTWVPYQRPTFVSPAFAAYVSGHSAFSRAGADILTAFTGSPFFPIGVGEFTKPAGDLLHEVGPTADVTLRWATYGDAADEAGLSRIYGGIHVPADDIAGRLMGAEVARLAWDRAQALF